MARRQIGVSFLPAAADKALKKMREEIRRWSLQNRTDKALDDLARMFNPFIRGWINYYSHYYKSALYDSSRRIDFHLRKWARRKYNASGISRKPRVSGSPVSSGPTQRSLRTGSFSMRHGWMLGAG